MPRTSKRMPEGPFYRELGRNLRVARSASGKSQTEIAEHLDVTFQQVQKYENGTNRIPVDRLVSLAAYLEVPLLQLIAPSDKRFRSFRHLPSNSAPRNSIRSWKRGEQSRTGLCAPRCSTWSSAWPT